MKILLVFPPSTLYGNDPTIPAVIPPLGLAYVAGYLEKHGYSDVQILDARSLSGDRVTRIGNRTIYGLTDEEFIAKLEEIKPDVVGISVMYTAYSGDGHNLARIIKAHNSDIPVIFGGAHASSFPLLVLKDQNVDVVSHFEGEETMLELVRTFENGLDIAAVKGISYRKEGEIIQNPARPFIEDLDQIPFPARHLLDMDMYLNHYDPSPYQMRAPSTIMITSRGCPQDCVYCSIKQVWGSKNFRSRSPNNVVDEIEYLHKEYGIQEFGWLDDAAGTNKKRLHAICDEIVRRKLDIRWTTPNGIAHWYLDETTLDKMKASGCYRVTFGIESGNIETRKFLGKPFKLEQAERMIHHANKIGMWTICTFIIGFPFEDEKAIQDTIAFSAKCGTDMAVFYLLGPFPGTRVYEVFKQEGLLNYDQVLDPKYSPKDEDFEAIGMQLASGGVGTRHFTTDQLREHLATAYRTFFRAQLKRHINPMHILRKVRSMEDFRYTTRLIRVGLNMAFHSIFNKFKCQSLWRDTHKKLYDNPDGLGSKGSGNI